MAHSHTYDVTQTHPAAVSHSDYDTSLDYIVTHSHPDVPHYHHTADDDYFASASSSDEEESSSSSDEEYESTGSERDPEVLTHLFQQSDSLKPKDFPQIDTSKYRPVTIPTQKFQGPPKHAQHPPKSPYIQEGPIHRALLEGGSPETYEMAKAAEKAREDAAKAKKA